MGGPVAKLKLPNKFLFMKVGNHAGETWDQILARKRKEYEKTGMIFWGYGGSACHPISQVQPFARLTIKEEGNVKLVMQPIKSNSDQDEAEATEFSEDGMVWKPIPKGIHVTGSRYALVLDEIKVGDLDLYLDEFEVGIGPSTGKVAEKYLTGRTDKGCLVKRSDITEPGEGERKVRKVQFMADLKAPFGVLLRR
jgi:hypothetical protein